MPRGNGPVTKVFYKGSTDDFIVFVESPEELEAWRADKSIPLVQVVDSFKVLVSHKHGAQGELDTASKATLENEFGTSNEDEVVKKILQEGQLQTSSVSYYPSQLKRKFARYKKTTSADTASTSNPNVPEYAMRPKAHVKAILLHRL